MLVGQEPDVLSCQVLQDLLNSLVLAAIPAPVQFQVLKQDKRLLKMCDGKSIVY